MLIPLSLLIYIIPIIQFVSFIPFFPDAHLSVPPPFSLSQKMAAVDILFIVCEKRMPPTYAVGLYYRKYQLLINKQIFHFSSLCLKPIYRNQCCESEMIVVVFFGSRFGFVINFVSRSGPSFGSGMLKKALAAQRNLTYISSKKSLSTHSRRLNT
jgi:hypothetical protein